MDVSLHHYYLDIEQCSAEIIEYVTDVNNWPAPIIPGEPGCDAMELEPERFDLTSTQWICSQAGDGECNL